MNTFCFYHVILITLNLHLINCNRVIELNEKFLDIYQKDRSTRWLVKFYAPWCHYCKQLEPIYMQVAQMLHNQDVAIYVARIDCTRYSSIASKFAVKGFPTILFISADKTVEFVGDRTKEDLVDFANRLSG